MRSLVCAGACGYFRETGGGLAALACRPASYRRASLAIWRKFGEFDQSRDFFAWARSFAFYEAQNFQRISARSRLHFDDELMNRLAQERVADLDNR